MAIPKNPEITAKRILAVAAKAESMPPHIDGGDPAPRQKWWLENLGDVTIRELEAAMVMMDMAESLATMINKQIERR